MQPDGSLNTTPSPADSANQGSGAESTIHGLLAMQVLDASPDLAALARASATVSVRDGLTVVEAETETLTGNAIVAPVSSYDRSGRLVWTAKASGSSVFAVVAPGDFTIVTR